MGRPVLRRAALILLVLVLLPGQLRPQRTEEDGIQSEVLVDWEADVIEITIRGQLTNRELDRPDGLARAEQRIRRAADRLVLEGILLLPADSRQRVSDMVLADPVLQQQLSRLAAQQQALTVRPTRDLASVALEYRVQLDPVRSLVSARLQPGERVEREWAWVPSADFSGLLVYAADPLPRYAEPAATATQLQPALTFTIYSETGEPVAVLSGLPTDAPGPVYLADTDERPITGTIGLEPLRVLARQAFGESPVDPVISATDAARLRSRSSNLQMLAEGRIAVVVHPMLLRQTLR